MYVPPAFKDDEIENIRATIGDARLANLVTSTADGLVATEHSQDRDVAALIPLP